MKVKELEEEKFKQAIREGLEDYCMGGNCSLMRLNKTIFKQFCRTFHNGSFDASQVAIIGKSTASLPNHTNVDFAVILRPVLSSKPVVVVNTTLEHIVRERADSISEHLGGYETIFVNNLHPVSCNDGEDVDSTSEVRINKEKNRGLALAVGIPMSIAIVLLVFTAGVWQWRRQGNDKRGRGGIDEQEHEYDSIEEDVSENDQREAMGGDYENMEREGVIEEVNDDDYEFTEENVPEGGASQRSRGGYENMESGVDTEQNEPERRERQRPVEDYERMQRGDINEDENHEESDSVEQNKIHAPGLSHSSIVEKKYFNDRQASLRRNRGIMDNQRRENNHEYVNELLRKNTVNEENEFAQKNGNQQSDGAYQDASASQHQETSDGTQGAQGQFATPRNVDKRDVSRDQDKQMSMSEGLETRRQPVENDDHPIQCTEDQEESLH